MSEIWNEAMKKWREQFYKGGVCTICGFVLEDVFPDGYPKEWKFCCSCLSWAKFITEIDNRVGHKEIENIIKNSPTIKKIYDKITLVKEND